MIEQDTIKLLRECDAGVKMGASSIHEVLDYVHSEELKQLYPPAERNTISLTARYRDFWTATEMRGRSPTPLSKKWGKWERK